MAWTWTGYDLDAVHRFKEENFFQTGRNLAEDRFWKTQIHGAERRGTRSSISLGEESPAGGHAKSVNINAIILLFRIDNFKL